MFKSVKYGDLVRLIFNFQNEIRLQMTPAVLLRRDRPAPLQAGSTNDNVNDTAAPVQSDRFELRPFLPQIQYSTTSGSD